MHTWPCVTLRSAQSLVRPIKIIDICAKQWRNCSLIGISSTGWKATERRVINFLTSCWHTIFVTFIFRLISVILLKIIFQSVSTLLQNVKVSSETLIFEIFCHFHLSKTLQLWFHYKSSGVFKSLSEHHQRH